MERLQLNVLLFHFELSREFLESLTKKKQFLWYFCINRTKTARGAMWSWHANSDYLKGRPWGPCERIVAGSEDRGNEAQFK